MPVHNFSPPQGKLIFEQVDCPSLQGNGLGDPSVRTIAVYIPETTDSELPLLLYLSPYTGSGLKNASWKAFGESLPQRIDRLISEGKMGPAIVVLPDSFTSLGGNQFVNSPTMGNWEDFVFEDLLPWVESRFPVRKGRHHRAVVGFSSGGYGALFHGLRHGHRWAGIACHSGDMGFDLLYRGEFPKILQRLSAFDGDVEQFLESFRATPKVGGADFFSLILLGQAASFDPDPQDPSKLRLPVDLHTCELIPERWDRWLAHDPLHMILDPQAQEKLRSLDLLYLDCGRRDPYNLQYGARTFVKRLQQADIPHIYEEFDDDHSGVDYRLDCSLPRLWQVIRDS